MADDWFEKFCAGELKGKFANFLNPIGIFLSISIFIAIGIGFLYLFVTQVPFVKDIVKSETFIFIFLIYATGFLVAFIPVFISLLVNLIKFNSIYRQNMRLLLCKVTPLGVIQEYDSPEHPTFSAAIKEFLFSGLALAFSCLLSWIQVLLWLVSILTRGWSWIFTPGQIKLYRWKISNIPFSRAEDFLKYAQEVGFASQSSTIFSKTVEELSKKSERLTESFAENIFLDSTSPGSRYFLVERYVEAAKRLTKEQNDSVVIHPRFWAISQNELSALRAIDMYPGQFFRETR